MVFKSIVLFCLFFFVEKTSQWKIRGTRAFKECLKSSKPLLVCTWHGSFIFPLFFLKNNHTEASVVSSTHKDSLVLGKVLQYYGFNLIKGSSTRGSTNVLKQMIKCFRKSGSVIAITNDGPKGPPKIAKQGSLNLAYKMDSEIIFISGKSSKFWKLPTWDSFVLPKPFSKNIIFIEKICFPTNINEQKVSSFVSQKMNSIQNEIDNSNL